MRRQWQRWVEAMFRTAARNGELADGVSAQDAAAAVVAAIVGFEALGADEGRGSRSPRWPGTGP